MLQRYFSSGLNPNFHDTQLVIKNEDMQTTKLFTAYRPGEQTDGSPTGNWRNIIRQPKQMQRNFYSTKFIPIKNTLSTGTYTFNQSGDGTKIPIHSEGNPTSLGNRETTQERFSNPLNPQEINLDISGISH